MKKLFKNQDGTFKVLNVTIFSFLLTALILGILCFPMFKKNVISEGTSNKEGKEETNVVSGDGLTCKECDIEFYDSTLTLAVGEGVKIKDILDLKDVDLINVSIKFDEDYLERKTVNGDAYIYAKDVLGDVEVMATYKTYKTKIIITITSDSITDASFNKDVYYVYKGASSKLDITTSPKGASLELVDLKSNDESIAEFDSNNELVGVSSGSTTITLTVGEKSDTATVYVIENDISVKIKVDGVYTALDKYEYPSSEKTMNLYLAIKFEDNNNKGYTKEDLSYSVKNSGSLSGVVSFDSVYSADASTYIYKMVMTYDSTVISEDNSSTVTFSLPDGSIKLFKVYK